MHNNVLSYSVYPHAGHSDSHMFTDVHFEEGAWYHVAIAHYIVSVPLTPKVCDLFNVFNFVLFYALSFFFMDIYLCI